VDSVLPNYREFIDLERKTLLLLRNDLSKRATFRHTADDAGKALDCTGNKAFSFCTHWDIQYMGENCRVFLGAGVEKSPRGDKIYRTSYYVSIVEGTEIPTKILRKFHFDYVTEDKAHPRFHLQYGGELPPAMETRGVTQDHIKILLPKVREPRIFYAPMTIGLLMNMLFYEFPNDDVKYAKEQPGWRKIIKENEIKVLKQFYSKCADLAGKRDAILFDQVYVK